MPSTSAKTSLEAMDRALDQLASARKRWAETTLDLRIDLLRKVKTGLASVADEWVRLSLQHKGGAFEQASQAQEWLAGPYVVMRNINLLMRTLAQIRTYGRPQLPGALGRTRFGRLAVPVFPTDWRDRLLFMGTRAEVRLREEVDERAFHEHLGNINRAGMAEVKTCLVLGGGNVSSIGPMDCLYKIFNEGRLCMLKMHPVNSYLGPLLSQAFAPLIEYGCMAIVYGDAPEGSYLCNHPLIEEIHITGSDKTHDLIVFGSDVAAQKLARTPLLNKPITSELGNVSPVIIVPGQWSESDLEYHAINLASSLVNNAGFNCNASRVIVTQRAWPQREKLLEKLRHALQRIPCKRAYYPGAKVRFSSFVKCHPEAELFGEPTDEQLPWVFISGLDPTNSNEICFQTEAFCGVFGEVPLEASSPDDFLAAATEFANERLWGTLNATLIIHPKTQRDPNTQAAFEQAIERLRYGTVSINLWAAVGYALCSTSWGAYPGHDLFDIRSGLDVVHNTYMLERIEKSVIYGPFRQRPIPAYFATHRRAGNLARNLFDFEATHQPSSLFKTLMQAFG